MAGEVSGNVVLEVKVTGAARAMPAKRVNTHTAKIKPGTTNIKRDFCMFLTD
jgi:hypothetical protein